jgi:CelD/BcsL family acetyltransferase involved in cellulose biosynthesis
MTLFVEQHTETGGFAALKPEWNALLARSYSQVPFLTWEWQSTWWQHLAEGKLLLLGFRAPGEGRLVGVAPLFAVQGKEGQRVLNVVGCRDVSDYLDLLVEEGQEMAVYTALLDFLASERAPDWHAIDLCNLPQTSPATERLRDMAAERGYQTLVELEDVCPVVPLPDTWEDYLSMLDKKQRHEVRRKLRRAAGQTQVEFYTVGPEHDLMAELDIFLDLHQKSSPEKDSFMDARMQRFFRDMARVFHDQGWLQLGFVTLDGHHAASILNFDYQDSILVYNSGYDPYNYAHLSPGILVTVKSIEHAIELGRATYDFLRGDEEYKYRLGGQDTQIHRLLIGKSGVSLEAVC